MNLYPSPHADRRLRVCTLCVGVLIALLLLALLLGGGSFSKAQLQSTVEEEVAGAVRHMNYEAGDTYQVTIQASDSADLLAASRGLLSSVRIESTFHTRDGASRSTAAQHLSGAGVIYRLNKDLGEAYILTNYHVVYLAEAVTEGGISDNIRLFLYGMESRDYAIAATFVGGSPYYDIAVLKVSGSPLLRASSAVAAAFADSDEISVLETAIAIGNPAAGGISATVGHVNVDSERITMSLVTDERKKVDMRVVRIDTAVNSGNSGGGLFNARGEIIGIVNAKVADQGVENIGYAIPANVAKNIAENILYYCDGTNKTRVYRCMLGIKVEAATSTTVYDTQTGRVGIREQVKITSVQPTAPVAGELRAGDILTAIRIGDTEKSITRTFHIIDFMLTARVGDTVTVTFLRDGTRRTATFTITEQALTAY